ncbi:MAG: 16S rRNA (guanine(527)-N(7))-methyltransferase RsmG [Alphaproteobacteria bacterium]
MKNYENFKKYFCDVSRETFDKLASLEEFLLDKNKQLNLISKNSESDVWNRHIEDSVQLFEYISDGAKTLVDIGTGSGFPFHVLAIIGQEKTPYLNFIGVESVSKKTLYLKEACESLKLNNAKIYNQRAESLNLKADVITARAVASLDKLLSYALPLMHKKTICIFPKGEKHLEEIKEAKIKYNFDVDIHQSKTSETGKILIISNIREKK